MSLAEIVAGVLVIGLVLFDVFQAVIVPRPSTSGIGLARYIVATTWRLWRRYGESLAQANKRERRLGAYAPFILVFLLFFWGATWSLTAWCELRDDFRSFRLDRMRELRIQDIRFADEAGHTLEDFFRVMAEDHHGDGHAE